MRGIAALGVLAVTAIAGMAGSAGAADDPMAVYYGNTLLSMNQPLYVIRLWLYPNHTFKQFKASHEMGTPHVAGWEGTWQMQGNQVCMTYSKTPVPASMPAPTPGCRVIPTHKMGDVWRVSFTDGPYKGTTETFTITEGHNTEP